MNSVINTEYTHNTAFFIIYYLKDLFISQKKQQ